MPDETILNEQHASTAPIEKSQIKKTDTGYLAYDDDAALTLIEADTIRCDNFLTMNSFAAQWHDSDILLQSPQNTTPYSGNRSTTEDIPRFTLSNHLSAIIPKMLGGLFYETPPFTLRPRPGVTPDIIRAKTAVLAAQLDQMHFAEEVELGFEQSGLLGTAIFKWGWEECDGEPEKVRVRAEQPKTVKTPFSTHKIDTEKSNDFTIEYRVKRVYRPWLKWTDLRSVLVDPSCRVGDIRKAGYVIYRDYVDYDYLNKLRDQEGYDIPSEEELKRLFFPPEKKQAGPDNQALTLPENLRAWIQHAPPRNLESTADPLKFPIEIRERWDKEKVIVEIKHGSASILIRNEENTYHQIPFYSFNWRNLPDCFYGIGLGRLIGQDQRVEQGALNAALRILSYSTKPMYLRKSGQNAPSQQIRQTLSGIIDVTDDVDKAFKILELPRVPAETWEVIGQSQASAAATSGANEQVIQGAASTGGKATGMRSATGAGAVIAANASRLDGPVEAFVRQVFEPWLWQMDDLDNDLLPASVLKEMVNEDMENSIELDHQEYRNAKIKFEVLAGAKLGPKREMAQFLPYITTLWSNPPFVQSITDAGYEIDGLAIFKAMADMAGWKYSQDFIKKMSPEKQAQKQANSPAALQAQQAQQAAAASTTKFNQEQTLLNQKNEGRAANEVIRQGVEQAITPLELEGETSPRGFGDTEPTTGQ